MLAELAEREIVVVPAQAADAYRVMDRDLGHEIARYALGRPAELRRRAWHDKQLQAAFTALRVAPTPLALMGLGSGAVATHGGASPTDPPPERQRALETGRCRRGHFR